MTSILIVEDDVLTNEYLEFILQQAGYEVVSATSADGLAGREHVPASALAASQPLHETDDRRARSDRPAQLE
jgi:CheY-like chemotaxis protein